MLSKLKTKFRTTKFTKSVALLAGATAIGQALGIIMMPIYTRIYSPSDFGGLAVYSSIIGILVVIASMRYELAIPQAKNDVSAANIVFLSIFIVFILTIVVSLTMFFWGNEMLALMGNTTIKNYLWLLPLSFFSAGLFNILNHWLIRTKSYPIITRTKLLQSVGQVITRLAFGISQQGVLGLIIANMVSQASGLTVLIRKFLRYKRQHKPVISCIKMHVVAIRYIRFPKFMALSSLMNASSRHLPSLLIATFYGAENAGFYLIAQNILGIPLSLVGTSVSQVFHGEAAELSRTKPEALLPLFKKVTKNLFFLGFIPVTFLITMGEPVFNLVLGERWGMAGKFSAILSFLLLLKFVISPVSKILFIIECQHITIFIQILLFSSSIISFCGAITLEATITEALLFFSVSMGFCYLSIYFVYLFQIKKYIFVVKNKI